MVDLSRMPLNAAGGRFFGRRDGAWMLLYEAVASRPACL